MFAKEPFQGGPGFIGSLTGRYVKKDIVVPWLCTKEEIKD
jgi:hypothetical protein